MRYYAKSIKYLPANNDGMIAIVLLLIVSAAALALTATVASLAIGEIRMAQNGSASLEQTYYDAESGLNVALYRLIANPVPGDYDFMLDDSTITIRIGLPPDDPGNPDWNYQRVISAQAVSPDGKVRKVQVTANTDSYAGGFKYAIQSGAGGIMIENNSQVRGDVYSNSAISGQGDNSEIYGNVWIAEDNQLSGVKVMGTVRGSKLYSVNIAQDAYYDILTDSGLPLNKQTTVSGGLCPGNPHCHAGQPPQPPKPLPLTDVDIAGWETDITSAGNPPVAANPDDCPNAFKPSFRCVMTSASYGFQKIEGGLYLDVNGTLTLTGNLWITGDLYLKNGSRVQIAPGLDEYSAVIIVDGQTTVENGVVVDGSGNPHSFVLIASTNTNISVASPAVLAANGTQSIVYAAIHGLLRVYNGASINAGAAQQLYLDQTSIVNYNPDLAIFAIPSGGGNDVGTALGTWQEL